jgi:DNA-directed RNA polymerase specialized sigma24 family protein
MSVKVCKSGVGRPADPDLQPRIVVFIAANRMILLLWPNLPGIAQSPIGDERTNRLVQAVRQLELPYRQVMTLLLEEFSYMEIGEALGISVANVGVRVSRAKSLLKELLHDR